MESVHGVDVSWMTHSGHNPKKSDHTHRLHLHHSPTTSTEKISSVQNGNGSQSTEAPTTSPKPIPIPQRPSFGRSSSTEKTATLNGGAKTPSPSPARRNSWLSSISSKFSSAPGAHTATTPPGGTAPSPTTSSPKEVPIANGPHVTKNVVLPHAAKPAGDVPYVPAPVKSNPSFLQSALRRLSSSGGQLQSGSKHIQYGLCERKVLNVDRHRERCHILELDQAKLRRVAFCVDVEIASGPRYTDEPEDEIEDKVKKDKKRLTEKGEGAALKNPNLQNCDKEEDLVAKAAGDELLREEEKDGVSEKTSEVNDAAGDKDTSKKKEKKKRSEEERKARKEKKRRLAEANGTLPVEIIRDELNQSQTSLGTSTPGSGTPKTQGSPTTDPARIYRRCCQLRETPILKKITEQLGTPMSAIEPPGVVGKLDLTGYWLQLPDLITLGDYLAVVPVKELIMENCGLTDEGVRVILAGLLAAKVPDYGSRYFGNKHGDVPQGGVVERVVFKNNNKIGRDGWRYICLFINMCRSLKSFDLSKVPFPQASVQSASPSHIGAGHLSRTTSASSATLELSCLLSKAIGERLAGRKFELLNLAECGISTDQLSDLMDGIIKSGLRRLGLAGNGLTSEGMKQVARFIQSGHCEGLDLGGNNLRDQMDVIVEALDDNSDLFALSLADCHLTPDSLWILFPALVKLKNFRFIDLSQNHNLFETSPSALSLLRRYLPKMPILKRIHLTDVSMTPEQAIALAEILPDTPSLAHVNIMENPKLAALANAQGEADQEEACALYASLMAAVRVSKTIICIDIEVPSNDSSEIVKALAKQVVAYCLWNMERGAVAEISEAVATITEPHGGEKEVAVPDVLLHIVGPAEGLHENHDDDDDEAAPDDDYVIGGTGVVKALGICLRNRANDSRRPSVDRTFSGMSETRSGSGTPTTPVSGGKAKQMSKNLLGSARKIRARLQPALLKESRSGDQNNYQRLLFLDRTLEGMIKRFEDEFPETRLTSTVTSPPIPDPVQISPAESLDRTNSGDIEAVGSDTEPAFAEARLSDDEGDGLRPILSRHNSDVSIASRALSQEEGRMHRFGQKFRREIIKPEGEDHEHDITGLEETPPYLKLLRAMVEGLGGEELRQRMESDGQDAVLEELQNNRSVMRQHLIDQDPEGWQLFVESMEAAKRNNDVASLGRDMSAIE